MKIRSNCKTNISKFVTLDFRGFAENSVDSRGIRWIREELRGFGKIRGDSPGFVKIEKYEKARKNNLKIMKSHEKF